MIAVDRGGSVQREAKSVTAAATNLRLLGGFGLRSGGERVPVPPTVQRVLAFVALRARPVLRSYLAGSLWPDVSERRAVANLRATLWRLPECAELIDSSRTEVALHHGVTVDFRAALALARGAIDGAPVTSPADGSDLVGDLLPGWDDEWVVVERERLRQLRLHALEAACQRFLEGGEPARAIDLALVIADDEPLRESVQRILVRAHLAEGNQFEALRTYERYRERVHAAMGVRPSPLMEEAIGLVVGPDVDLRQAVPAPA
jgi:DNA-binding SARP family transcriptional activator